MIEIKRATQEHVVELAPKIRESDQRECLAISGKSAQEGLWESFYFASMAWAVLSDGEVVAIAGCSGGSPWLLASEHFDRIRWTLARHCKRFIGYMLRRYETLFNFVDARNTDSIRWLKWCGFEVMPSEPLGIDGEHFHLFKMKRREDQCVSQPQALPCKARESVSRPGLLTEKPQPRT